MVFFRAKVAISVEQCLGGAASGEGFSSPQGFSGVSCKPVDYLAVKPVLGLLPGSSTSSVALFPQKQASSRACCPVPLLVTGLGLHSFLASFSWAAHHAAWESFRTRFGSLYSFSSAGEQSKFQHLQTPCCCFPYSRGRGSSPAGPTTLISLPPGH